MRGQAKVTVPYLKKKFPFLRKLGDTLVHERLAEAGLTWMRRRKKSFVPKKYVRARKSYCRWLLKQQARTLKKFAFTDGTVMFLDRTEEEHEDKQRRALGLYVWRRADCKDALFQECVGPSSYAKAQGMPVKIWGVLADGKLHVRILPKGENMNRWWYAWIVEHDFPRWLGRSCLLVQDYEKCLRCEEPLQAMADVGVEVIKQFPKCSQDMNPIENVWNLLKERLNDTMPVERESRDQFVIRVRRAVKWLNRNHSKTLRKLCNDQRDRAEDTRIS